MQAAIGFCGHDKARMAVPVSSLVALLSDVLVSSLVDLLSGIPVSSLVALLSDVLVSSLVDLLLGIPVSSLADFLPRVSTESGF